MRKIAVIGLGYVGLPVAQAFARSFPGVIGFDIDERKVTRLRQGIDPTGEASRAELQNGRLRLTAVPADLAGADFFIVAVPTPVDLNHQPDLGSLISASRTVGRALSKGAIVVYESTVYPGVTEEICGPILEKEAGLRCGTDFKLGYSPERINPGDKDHTFEQIVKVVSGQDAESQEIVAQVYGAVVKAGVYRAASIKVAEAAKVIENTQRDLNIALMNELAIIFDRLGICTSDVLEAAGTKWNFLRFSPGLVGGHCIGVDPYYLTAKAEQVGIHPQVILAGRRINDGMGAFVARRMVKMLIAADRSIQHARVVILGLTFKENVPDTRNSRIPDILRELDDYGVEVLICDPVADAEEARHHYGINLVDPGKIGPVDGVVYAVPHRCMADLARRLLRASPPPAAFVDVKSALPRDEIPTGIRYWRL
jgi:UDP-N-acetyl-D-galactosamine dehydrogenase